MSEPTHSLMAQEFFRHLQMSTEKVMALPTPSVNWGGATEITCDFSSPLI